MHNDDLYATTRSNRGQNQPRGKQTKPGKIKGRAAARPARPNGGLAGVSLYPSRGKMANC